MVFNVQTSVFVVFLVPLLGLLTNPFQLLFFFFIKWVVFVAGCIGDVKVLKGFDAIVLQDVTQIIHMVDLTDFLNLVNSLRITKADIHLSNGKGTSLQDLDTILWDVHPGASLRTIVQDMKTFKTVKF